MADELNKLSLKVEYNECFKDKVEEIKANLKVFSLPQDVQDLYEQHKDNLQLSEEILSMVAFKTAAENHISQSGTFLIKETADGNKRIGVSYKIPVKDVDENGVTQDYGNINFAVFGGGSIVFDDDFKDLFVENKPEILNSVQIKLTEVIRALCAGGASHIRLRNIDNLPAEKRILLSESIEQYNENNQPDVFQGSEYVIADEWIDRIMS